MLKAAMGSGTVFNQACSYLGLAHILFKQGEQQLAQTYFGRFQKLNQGMSNLYLKCLGHFYEARIEFETANRVNGLTQLRKALTLGRAQGIVGLLFWQPADMVCLCSAALDADIEVDFVKNLIRRHRLLHPEPAVAPDRWPWQVKIVTLGQFGVWIEDEPMRATGKAQHKLMSLLKVLIALGGRNVHQDTMVDILWPDAEGDVGRRAFDTTLHRLRKLLGGNQVLTLHDGQLSFDQQYTWLDTWAFERQAKDIEHTLEGEEDATQLKQQTERLLALYRGPLLRDEPEQSWLIHSRQYQRQHFIRLIAKIGEYWGQRGAWPKAIDCYQEGLEREEFAEALYLRLMQAFQQQNRTVDVIATYQRCRDALASKEMVPSAEIEVLNELLVRAQPPK